MKRTYLFLLFITIVTAGGVFFGGQSSAAVPDGSKDIFTRPIVSALPTPDYVITEEDEDLKKLYTEASIIARRGPDEGQGCLTMPYVDLQRTCAPLMEKKRVACHPAGGNLTCGGALGDDLRRAILARDRASIIQIRTECMARVKGLEKCSLARKNGTPIWDRAQERVETDRRLFSKKQAAARTAKDPKAAEFWRQMQQAADHILNYYRPGIENHKAEMGVTFDHVRECEKNIEAANAAL